MYYGYGIVISPIYYAGNTAEEHEAFVEKAVELKRRVNVRSYGPSLITPKIKRKNRKYWKERDKLLEERTPQDYENLKKHLTQYGDRPTRYVYASRLWKSDEDVLKKAETYQEVEEVLFEGYSFYAMKNGREWVDAVYGKKGIERMEKARFQFFYAYGLEVLRQVQLIQLELLKEVDRICRKHGIRYYISFGTLLGAVRHGGFIPWDDDADVVMMWEDYCKFCEVVESELEHEKFFFRTPYTDKNCNIAISRLHRNGTRMSYLSRESIDTHTGVWLDIFPMFPGNRLRIAERIRDRLCRFFKTMLWTHLGAAEEKRRLHRWYYKLLSKVSNQKAYELFLKTGNMRTKETDNLMFPYVLHWFYSQGEGVTSKKNYGTPVDIEFEGYRLMAPANAVEILTKTYGSDCLKLPPYGARLVPHNKIEFLDLREVEPL